MLGSRSKLHQLLEIHNESATQTSLAANLGDGYLLRNNSTYRNIRNAVTGLGFRFTTRSVGFYDVHPLSQLSLILAKRTIPYANNVAPLRWIARKVRDTITWDTAVASSANHLLHESAHGVAHWLASRMLRSDRAGARTTALISLMEEAFANAVEYLAACHAKTVCHRIFLRQNVYFIYDIARTKHLVLLQQEIGHRAALKTIWLAFLHANFLFKDLSELRLERCLDLATDGNAAAIARVQRAGARRRARDACAPTFELDPAFRLLTTRLFFRMAGIATPLRKLLDFDFMARLERQDDLRHWLDLVCDSTLVASISATS